MKYRKKPVVIDAERFVEHSGERIAEWAGGRYREDERGPHIVIPTLEGDHRADPGDWIICGVKGEFYPCKPDIFDATYEPVS